MSCLVPVVLVGFIHFIDGSLITISPGKTLYKITPLRGVAYLCVSKRKRVVSVLLSTRLKAKFGIISNPRPRE